MKPTIHTKCLTSCSCRGMKVVKHNLQFQQQVKNNINNGSFKTISCLIIAFVQAMTAAVRRHSAARYVDSHRIQHMTLPMIKSFLVLIYLFCWCFLSNVETKNSISPKGVIIKIPATFFPFGDILPNSGLLILRYGSAWLEKNPHTGDTESLDQCG